MTQHVEGLNCTKPWAFPDFWGKLLNNRSRISCVYVRVRVRNVCDMMTRPQFFSEELHNGSSPRWYGTDQHGGQTGETEENKQKIQEELAKAYWYHRYRGAFRRKKTRRENWVSAFFLNAVQQIIDSETLISFSTPRGILDVFLRCFHFNIVGTISQH